MTKLIKAYNKIKVAFKIAAIYFFISFLWILFSDKFLLLLTDNIESLSLLQTYKGWFFISTSTVLIYILIKRELELKNKIIATINASERWYNVLASNIPNANVFLFDTDFRFILAKGQEMSKHGEEFNNIQGKLLHEFIEDNVMLRYFNIQLKKVLTGKKVVKEIYYKNEWYEFRSEPVKNEKGNIIAGILILINFSDRKKQEKKLVLAKAKAEESDQLKSAFLANMSHEIRTPLNGLLGFSELLAKSNLNDIQKEKYLGIIKNSGKHLLNLIDDLLDISRIEVNQVAINKTMFGVNTLIDELFEFYKENDIIKNNKIKIQIHKDLDQENDIIYTDKSRLHQIITNLINNAVKFTEKGSIEIGYKIHTKGKSLVFFVRDTGLGIPPDKVSNIFDRFRQVEEPTGNSNRKGTGLGLAISKGLIKALDGEIWVESKLNQGSTFYFTLPYHSDEASNNFDFDEPLLSERININKLLLLNVTQDSIMIRSYLANSGVQLLNIVNSNEAIDECLNDDKIFHAIIEHNAPFINGLEITKTIKRFRPDIRIILLVDHNQIPNPELRTKSGVDTQLTKPFTKNELINILRNG